MVWISLHWLLLLQILFFVYLSEEDGWLLSWMVKKMWDHVPKCTAFYTYTLVFKLSHLNSKWICHILYNYSWQSAISRITKPKSAATWVNAVICGASQVSDQFNLIQISSQGFRPCGLEKIEFIISIFSILLEILK